MRRRLLPLLLLFAIVVGGCSSHPAGPSSPMAPDQVTPDDAVKAAGARQAARAFVDAYASATGADSAALHDLVGTDLLLRWVHWLEVQNAEFPGKITGSVTADQIGPASAFSVSSVPGSEAILRQVEVAAAVTFSFDPVTGPPVSVSRSLDGPMRLILEPSGLWKVLDFTRDGIPLSRAFQVVKDAAASNGSSSVKVATFFAVPYWEFGLVVAAKGPASVDLKRTAVVDATGAVVEEARTVTRSLTTIGPGAPVEGIVTFAARSDPKGLILRVVLTSPGGKTVTLEIPLEGKIDPVPVSTSQATPSG